jgi:hypothetical protein
MRTHITEHEDSESIQRAQEVRATFNRRTQERAVAATLESENAALDEQYRAMPPTEREALDAQVLDRLGVLGQVGKARAAVDAMRRNLLREQGRASP